MGVLNKLKSRMTGRNALTRGPGKEYEFEIGKDYTKDFDITGQKSKNYTSGQEAVSEGLAAGANQPEVYYEDRSQEIAEIGAKLGSALAGKIATGEDNRKKELDQLQTDNPDMTRGEARKKRRKIKEMDKANEKYLKSLPKGKELEAGIKNITDKGYDTKDTCTAKGGTLGFMGRDEATGKGFGKCSV